MPLYCQHISYPVMLLSVPGKCDSKGAAVLIIHYLTGGTAVSFAASSLTVLLRALSNIISPSVMGNFTSQHLIPSINVL